MWQIWSWMRIGHFQVVPPIILNWLDLIIIITWYVFNYKKIHFWLKKAIFRGNLVTHWLETSINWMHKLMSSSNSQSKWKSLHSTHRNEWVINDVSEFNEFLYFFNIFLFSRGGQQFQTRFRNLFLEGNIRNQTIQRFLSKVKYLYKFWYIYLIRLI